jgi:hypothetical protein
MALPSAAAAQYPFGKNKVTYRAKDWKVLKTEHVDIYHYPNESNLILYVAPMIEETFAEYSELFDVEFRRRLPFVFYASHYDFQQTNILPYLISEYTGGFTDLMKGRVAVPFTGSYANFRHVVRHELVHAFMLEKINQVMHEHGKFTYPHPPLWFVEGMAEYLAGSPQGTRGNMFVRDALVHDRLLDLEEIWRIQGSFMMYKEGEAVVNYIANNFGEEAVIQILENWWMSDQFPVVLKRTINLDLGELNDAFMKHIKRRYYPAILRNSFATDIGRQVTPERSFHNRAAVTMGEGGEARLFALCAHDGVIDVAELLDDGEKYRRDRVLAKGSRSASLESIPAFRSKIEAHGDTLVFVSKSSARDVIYFWDTNESEQRAAFSFSGLSLLASPTLSGDGTRMVFSAIDSTGRMDLFLYDLRGESLERLTNDNYSDEDPDYSPTRDVILFTSDRDAGPYRDRTHIYRMDLATRAIEPVEGGNHADSNPEWAPDGKSFLYVSDREGTFNVYHHKDDVVVRQTNALGGVTSPAFNPDGNSFVATVYTAGEFHIFEFPLKNGDGGRIAAVAPPDTSVDVWSSPPETDRKFVTQDYTMKLGVDFVGAGIAIDPEYGDVGNGGQLVLTDVLGNHQFFMFFGNTSEGFDDFWKRVNAGVTYVNLSNRLNYSLSVFQLNTYRFGSFSDTRRERRFGGAIGVRYPFNKFQRVEGSIVARQIERENEFSDFGLGSRQSFTGSAFLTYVHDNTLWTIGGPLLGSRYYVTGGQTVDFLGRGFANTNLQLDVRHYVKLASRVVLAARYLTRNTWGSDEQYFYLGGPWSLRGYDFREFRGRTIHLINSEVRFPLIDRFAIALPFGVIEIPMFRGAMFFDAGQATRNLVDFLDTEWLGSFGLGTEINLGYAPVIRVNFTRTTDFDTISTDTGLELFIGYNY